MILTFSIVIFQGVGLQFSDANERTESDGLLEWQKGIVVVIQWLDANKHWIKPVLRVILDKHKEILDEDSYYLLRESEWEWYQIGKRALHAKNYNIAVEYFRKIITNEPEVAGAYFYLGLAYLNKASTLTARRCFKKAFVLYFM